MKPRKERIREWIKDNAQDLFDNSDKPDIDYNQGIQMLRDRLLLLLPDLALDEVVGEENKKLKEQKETLIKILKPSCSCGIHGPELCPVHG